MILIADSGSTKTTWMEVETGNKMVTEGLNPHFTTDEQLLAACTAVRHNFHISSFNLRVFFYGAGCGNETQRQRAARLLMHAFGTEEVTVETDMMGACRAVSGDKASLVGILGTGSNACYYDGSRIAYRATSTGYILGDHGSANHIGRLFLQEYLTGMVAPDVAERFRKEYNLSDEAIIDAVYHSPQPNRFLASVAPFVVSLGRRKHYSQMLRKSFDDWIYYQILPFLGKANTHTLNLVGSYAKAMESMIRRFAEETPLEIGTVVADPINGLREYHKEHNLKPHTT